MIPEPMVEIKRKFFQSEKIPVVNTNEDIEILNKLLASELRNVQSTVFDNISIQRVETQFILAKTYFDPSSASDNFI